MENPFNPNFGQVPEMFFGRQEIIEELLEAAKNPRSPWRTTLLIGVRGTGKTALMRDVSRMMTDAIVISVSSNAQLTVDILDGLSEAVFERKLGLRAKVGIPGVLEVEIGSATDDPKGFMGTARHLLNALNAKEQLVIFTVDEVQGDMKEMITFAHAYQQFLGEGYNVMLIMSGLPNYIDKILRDKSISFLRRSQQVTLAELPSPHEIIYGYEWAFQKTGKPVSDEIAEDAVFSTWGYPYMTQLLGYHLWNQASEDVTAENLAIALDKSREDMFTKVHRLVISELPDRQVDFLKAMADISADGRVAKIADIREALDWEVSQVGVYRHRLIDAGIIRPANYGEVRFTIPFTKEYFARLDHPVDYVDVWSR